MLSKRFLLRMLSISISFQQLDRLDESLPEGSIVLLDSGERLLQQLYESLPGGGIHRGSRPSGLWRVPAPAAG
jgi:hypothetical protein